MTLDFDIPALRPSDSPFLIAAECSMPNLKPISKAGIPASLQKAERYRLLNDSTAAESICLDIVELDPENQSALVTLLLSLTDQFGDELSDGVRRAREVL